MNTVNNITLEKINDDFAIQLVEILNTDSILQDNLGSKKHKISKDEFIKYNEEWAKSSNSEIFAISLNYVAIGMISLSHQNIKEKKAQIGYWITSKCWRKGYTAQAFSQMLNYAKQKGLKHLTAKIKRDNLASKRIWGKHGANMKLIDNKFYVSIVL